MTLPQAVGWDGTPDGWQGTGGPRPSGRTQRKWAQGLLATRTAPRDSWRVLTAGCLILDGVIRGRGRALATCATLHLLGARAPVQLSLPGQGRSPTSRGEGVGGRTFELPQGSPPPSRARAGAGGASCRHKLLALALAAHPALTQAPSFLWAEGLSATGHACWIREEGHSGALTGSSWSLPHASLPGGQLSGRQRSLAGKVLETFFHETPPSAR